MQLDDLNVGDAITVKRGKEEAVINHNPFSWGQGETSTRTQFDGDVLIVKAIKLPYIIVNNLSNTQHRDYNMDMDTRLFEFMRLDDAYVNAVKENHVVTESVPHVCSHYVVKEKKSSFWSFLKK
jgi:hypothetical protein